MALDYFIVHAALAKEHFTVDANNARPSNGLRDIIHPHRASARSLSHRPRVKCGAAAWSDRMIPALQLRRDPRIYGKKRRDSLFGGSSLLQKWQNFIPSTEYKCCNRHSTVNGVD
jgi:hypothetical protein